MLRTFRRKLAAAAIVACAVAGAVIGTSLAGGGGGGQVVGGGASPAKSVSALAAPVGHGIDSVVVTQGPANFTLSTTTPTALPGMTVDITVPAGHTAMLIARFSAESACYGNSAGSPDWCIATIKVNGTPMFPNTGNDFAFDSSDNGSETSASWESHAMERWLNVSAGTYRVTVFGSVTQFGATPPIFWTGERELTVESSLTS